MNGSPEPEPFTQGLHMVLNEYGLALLQEESGNGVVTFPQREDIETGWREIVRFQTPSKRKHNAIKDSTCRILSIDQSHDPRRKHERGDQ